MSCECKDHGNEKQCGSECGCNCGGEDFPSIFITFEGDETEEEVECDVVGIFEVKNKEYIALTPKVEGETAVDEEGPELMLFRYEEKGDEIELSDIESDEEYDAVVDEFNNLFFGDEDIQE